MFRVARKLSNVKRMVKAWNKSDFGHLFSQKEYLSTNLTSIQASIQENGYDASNSEEELSILSDLHDIISKEEKFWRQRSRINWLKEGDQNTKFFHLSTLKHRANNRIFGLKKDQGVLTKEEDISLEAASFFSSLLSWDPCISKVDQDDIVSCIRQILQLHHNNLLQAIPFDFEVREALFSLPTDKSPGPNGFPTFFFQTYWLIIIKRNFVKAVQEFFGAKSILKEINSTFLVLIPKVPGADTLDKFRPINLCNSFYKIISKVLTLRLLKLLPLIISQQQFGFVPSRQILDSIIMVHEVIHSMEAGKREGMLLELDMSRAYNQVDWSFLELVLKAFVFDVKSCKLISQLVTTPSLAVLVNGSPSDFFKPTRGLHQGDPLSPILFIILAECIGRLMEKKKKEGRFKGFKPSSKCTPFMHQQFVDDTIMGGEASIREAKAMKETLNTYSSGSRQLINWDKSSIFFINTLKERQQRISRILGCQVGKLPSTYLGLPLGLTPSDSFWNGIMDRFNKKLVGWKGATLSQARKCQLVKSILQNFPIYALSLFTILKKYVKRMEKIQRDSLWMGTKRNKRYPLVPWDKVFLPKKNGGLGIRKLTHINKAHLQQHGGMERHCGK